MQHLSNSLLVEELKRLVTTERGTTAEIVQHLHQVWTRKLYLELGYSSLFIFCVEGLGYSKASAHRRSVAAKASAQHPDLLEKLRTGTLTLCAIAELYKVDEVEQREVLISACEGKSKEDVARIVAPFLPVTARIQETVTIRNVQTRQPLTAPLFDCSPSSAVEPSLPREEIRYEVKLPLDEECMALLEKAMCLTGTRTRADALKKVLKEFIRRRSPEERMQRRDKRRVTTDLNRAAKVTSRRIAGSMRDAVTAQDHHRCTFIGSDGRRCCETRNLQVDHIQPFALGGSNNQENLRLLCGAHNRWAAEKVFAP